LRPLPLLWLGILIVLLSPAQQKQRGIIPAPVRAQEIGKGSYYALIIGVDQYQKLPALQTAVNDASSVEALLRQRYGFQTKLLVDGQATRAGIVNALSEYRQDLNEDDSLLIYYAGHGQYDKDADKAYWLPVDADLNSPAYWISADDITTDVRVLPARHVLIVSDSCFSGGLTRDASASPRPDDRDIFVQKMESSKSRTLLSSGGNEPVADSGNGGHSVFANAILSGLAQMPGKAFTAASLFENWIVVPVAGASAQIPQYNVIRNSGHDAGDFVFVPGTSASTSASTSAGLTPPNGNVSPRPQAPAPATQVRQPQASDAAASRARDALRSRGIGVDITSVKNALISVDLETLKMLSSAAIQPAMIEEAFRQHADGNTSVARRFFENSASSSEAMEWFDSALAHGVDPNMTIPSDYYEREGILLEAMRAANWPALKTLLARGASPHAYQNLFLTRYPEPRFIFPLQYIADDDRLSLQEKQALAKMFLAAGTVIPKVIPPSGGMGWKSVMYAAKQLQDETAPKLGMTLPTSPDFCEQQPNPICKQASSRTGEDWCSLVAAVPKKLAYAGGASSTPLYDVTLQYLLGIEGNKMYFLGLTKEIGYEYVLAEVSKDASSWTVLKMMSPEAGMGLCKKEADGFQDDNCWRRVSLHRVPGKDEMRFEDWGISWRISADDCSSRPK
jgi:hypothetical protein